jgi:hypothetical protein
MFYKLCYSFLITHKAYYRVVKISAKDCMNNIKGWYISQVQLSC